MVTASALGGYAVHTIIADKPAPAVISAPVMQNTQPANTIATPSKDASTVTNVADQSLESAPKKNTAHKSVTGNTSSVKTDKESTGTISGTGGATAKPPIFEKSKK